jgi:hypothetical protein
MSEPLLLVLNRNFTLATTKGHVIEFKKGVPTNVPKAVYQDALSIGAQPPDGSEPVVDDDKKKDAAPQDPAERNPLILAAIEALIDRNEREDFTAAGSPTVDAVSKEVGFKVAAKEIAGQWQAYHEKKAQQ